MACCEAPNLCVSAGAVLDDGAVRDDGGVEPRRTESTTELSELPARAAHVKPPPAPIPSDPEMHPITYPQKLEFVRPGRRDLIASRDERSRDGFDLRGEEQYCGVSCLGVALCSSFSGLVGYYANFDTAVRLEEDFGLSRTQPEIEGFHEARDHTPSMMSSCLHPCAPDSYESDDDQDQIVYQRDANDLDHAHSRLCRYNKDDCAPLLPS